MESWDVTMGGLRQEKKLQSQDIYTDFNEEPLGPSSTEVCPSSSLYPITLAHRHNKYCLPHSHAVCLGCANACMCLSFSHYTSL